MACVSFDLVGCSGEVARQVGDGLTGGAFDSVVRSFADAANTLLEAFAKAFVAIPPVDLSSPGIHSVYEISLGLAALVACLLLIGQVIRTALTHDGSALAVGLIGLGKAVLVVLLTLSIAMAALRAADEVTELIVVKSFGSTKALTDRLAGLVHLTPGAAGGSALILLLAVVGILLTLVLWFELLLRNAAIAVLVATSPIAAAGQLSEATRGWWTKTAVATVQLIVLKPVIALVFALGFAMTGKGTDLPTLLAGLLVLVLAVFAWPAIARFFAFTSVAVGGAAGLGGLLGYAAGRGAGAGGAGGVAGVDPDDFSRAAEARTMAGHDAGLRAAGGARGMPGGGVAGKASPAAAAVRAAQAAINGLSGGLDSMAGHAGMGGRSGYAAGMPRPRAGYGAGGGGGLPPVRGASGPGAPVSPVPFGATIAGPPPAWPEESSADTSAPRSDDTPAMDEWLLAEPPPDDTANPSIGAEPYEEPEPRAQSEGGQRSEEGGHDQQP